MATAPAAPKLNHIGLPILDYRGGKTTLCAGCGHNSISERIIEAMFEIGRRAGTRNVAIYLWPDYHSFTLVMRGHHLIGIHGPPPYWVQVNQHFFFAVYSFVVMGIVAVFEWELFFPDLLDIFVLKPLPVPDRRTFLARVTAIAILLGGFLFDANILATIALPSGG